MHTRQSAAPLFPSARHAWSYVDDLSVPSELPSVAAILPEQFHRSPVGLYGTQAEAALMRAVLEDAIWCFQKQFIVHNRRVQRLAQEAERWFFSDDLCWPFSFVNICTVLGLEPEYVRRGLQRWRQQHPATRRRKTRHVAAARRPITINEIHRDQAVLRGLSNSHGASSTNRIDRRRSYA